MNVVFLIVRIIRCLLTKDIRLLFILLHACSLSRKDRQRFLFSGAIFFAYLLSPLSLTIFPSLILINFSTFLLPNCWGSSRRFVQQIFPHFSKSDRRSRVHINQYFLFPAFFGIFFKMFHDCFKILPHDISLILVYSLLKMSFCFLSILPTFRRPRVKRTAQNMEKK